MGVPHADKDRETYDVGRRIGWIVNLVGVKWRER
jgi:hypothetical protein